MTGNAANADKITIFFHHEPLGAKTITIPANGLATSDTTQAQVKVTISGIEYVAIGGTFAFSYSNNAKKVDMTDISIFKQGTPVKKLSASFQCD
jgi:hypothetical protein